MMLITLLWSIIVEVDESEITPIFTEVNEGETPLGGEMRIQSPWNKKTD